MQVTLAEPDLVAVSVIVSPLVPPDALTVGVLSLVMLSVDEEPVSDAAARSTPLGAAGALVSIVIGSDSVVPALPARSVTDAVIVQPPSARVPRVQFVLAPTVYVHVTLVEPAFAAVMVMTSPVAWPGIVIVGVLSLVTLSVGDEPRSEPASRSGVRPVGPVESIVIDSALEAVDVLPAGSVRVAVTLHVPSVIVGIVQLDAGKTYEQEMVVVPFVAVSVIVSPVEPPLALMVGVVSLVALSVLEEPESELVARSTPDGADGAVASTVMDSALDAAEVPPVGCVSVAVIDHVPLASVPRLQPVAGIT